MTKNSGSEGPGGGRTKNSEINPLHRAARCGAKTRKKTSCQSPAMKNGRCRMHGGASTGAPKGNQNALKHGYFTAKALAERKYISALIRQSREMERELV